MEGASGPEEPSRSAHEQRQGAAIARQLARGLRLGTTLFTQQEPRRATSVQNSPSTPLLTACAVQNSPRTPASPPFRYKTLPARPLSPPFRDKTLPAHPKWPNLAQSTHAGRVLYRTQGRDRASQHNSTPGPTGLEDAGGSGGTGEPGRGAGCRLAGPAWVGRTTATQISHAIRLVQISTNAENAAIPTMQIQYLNKLLGNCMRNCCADRPGRGAARRRRGLAGLRDATPRPPHTHFAHNFPRSFFETTQKRCNSNDMNSIFEALAGELRAELLSGRAWPGFETTHTPISTPRATGVEGAGGSGGHGRASRHGAERSEALASRAAGPDGARNTSGATLWRWGESNHRPEV